MSESKVNVEEVAVFGAGCFWCVEAVYAAIDGVRSVTSGYSGGHIKNPAYREVCSGRTGHAEVVRIVFDPNQVTYEQLLEVFFQTHDPTTLNRQGADVGTQYRSVIFYSDESQKAKAEAALQAASESDLWSSPIVTSIEPLQDFYPAEVEHHNYFELHPDQPYCAAVIRPKMDKFRSRFSDLLKA